MCAVELLVKSIKKQSEEFVAVMLQKERGKKYENNVQLKKKIQRKERDPPQVKGGGSLPTTLGVTKFIKVIPLK